MQNRRGRLLTAAAIAIAMTVSPFSAQAAQTAGIPEVEAELETPALFDDDAGGNANADDPAIWLHPTHPARSVVIGTAKEGGLFAYSLSGSVLQAVPVPAPPRPGDEGGRFNNVDLLYDVKVGGTPRDLAVVSDRGRDQLRVYRIDPAAARVGAAPLVDVTDPAAPLIFSVDQDEVNEQRTVYGLAAWQDRATGRSYALVSRRDTTELALLRLIATPAGRVTYTVERTLTMPASFTLPNGANWQPCLEPGEDPQFEGMVVDARTGTLYAGQEDVGIWRMPATLLGTPVLVDRVREYGVPATYDPATDECTYGTDPGYGGTHLSSDVEGLTIYYRGAGRGYLLASSQGENAFAVYQLQGANAYQGHFRVVADDDPDDPDGSEVCDGAAVLNVPLGSTFDEGLLVVHDGENTPVAVDENGEVRENTNFKFVKWDDVAEEAGLVVDTSGWSPRS
ncbi:phytase [Micromonospora sonneratiae]|uniref:Phytase n=1 Tax=Micromonospora sonneratiae TaxID=1184706 RepID=A0ABW3Y590_9ACTN